MMNYDLTNANMENDNERMFRTHTAFRKIFRTEEGREVIRTLNQMTRFHPRSDLECARLCGMQAMINIILDLSEYFGNSGYDR